MPSDPQFNSYLPGSDPQEIGVSSSKDREGQIYGRAGASSRCFYSKPLPTGASGEEVLALGWEKEKSSFWSQSLLWSVAGELGACPAGPAAKAPAGVEGDITSTDKA